MLRLLPFAIILFLCWLGLSRLTRIHRIQEDAARRTPSRGTESERVEPLMQCPTCQVRFLASRGVVGHGTHFCSKACLDKATQAVIRPQ